MRAFFYPGGASGHRVQRPAAAPRPSISICPFPPRIEMEVTYAQERKVFDPRRIKERIGNILIVNFNPDL